MSESALRRRASQRSLALLEQAAPQGAAAEADGVDMTGAALAGATSEAVRAAAVDALRKHRCDHYTRRPGIAPLCKAVAASFAVYGVGVDPDSGVTITGGLGEARYAAVRALAEGRTVYLPQVAEPGYAVAAEFAGAPVQRVDLAEDLPALGAGLLVVANPNPATGALVSPVVLAEVAAWAVRTDSLVVADESAAPLLNPEAAFRPLASYPGMAERTVTIGSFADTPGLEAWHVTWVAGAKKALAPVRDLKQAITICTAAPSQYAALATLDYSDREAIVQQVERIEAVSALLDRLGIPYVEPDTVAYVVADAGGLGGGDRVAAACAAAGVRVQPGSTFGDPDSVRIGASSDHFGAGLGALERALSALQEGRA